MKKSLLVLAVGALVATTANAGLYIQADLGSTKVKSDMADDGQFNKNTFEGRLSVGYQISDFRVALDYSHYGNIKSFYKDQYITNDTTLKVRSLGLTGFYDFNFNSPIKPFVGARIALNRFTSSGVETSEQNGQKYVEAESGSESKVGFGVLAGVSYNFTSNLALVGAVEYNRLGQSGDVKVNAYGAKLGVRYSF